MKFIVLLLFESVIYFCVNNGFSVVYSDSVSIVSNEQAGKRKTNGPNYSSANLDTEEVIANTSNETSKEQMVFEVSRPKRQASRNNNKKNDKEIKITVDMSQYNVLDEKMFKKQLEGLLNKYRLDRYEKDAILNINIVLKEKLTQHQKNKLRTSISQIVRGTLQEHLKMYLFPLNEENYGQLLEQKIEISKHRQDKLPIIDMNNDLQMAHGVLRNIIHAEMKKFKKDVMRNGQSVSFAMNFLPPSRSTRKNFVFNLKWIYDIVKKEIPCHKTIKILTDSQMRRDTIKIERVIIYIIPLTRRMIEEEDFIKEIVMKEIIPRIKKINKRMLLKFNSMFLREEMIAGLKQKILTVIITETRNLPNISEKRMEKIFNEISKIYPQMELVSYVTYKSFRNIHLILSLYYRQPELDEDSWNSESEEISPDRCQKNDRTEPNKQKEIKHKVEVEAMKIEDHTENYQSQTKIINSYKEFDDKNKTQQKGDLSEDKTEDYETNSEITTEIYTEKYREHLDIVSTEDLPGIEGYGEIYKSEIESTSAEVLKEKLEEMTTTKNYFESYVSKENNPEVEQKDYTDILEVITTEDYSVEHKTETEIFDFRILENENGEGKGEINTEDHIKTYESKATTFEDESEKNEEKLKVTTTKDYYKNDQSQVDTFGNKPVEFEVTTNHSKTPEGMEVSITETYANNDKVTLNELLPEISSGQTEDYSKYYDTPLGVTSSEVSSTDFYSMASQADSNMFTEQMKLSFTEGYPKPFESETGIGSIDVLKENYEELITTKNYSKNYASEVTNHGINHKDYEDISEETSTVGYTRDYKSDQYEDRIEVATTKDDTKNYETNVTASEVEIKDYKDRFEVSTTEDHTKSYESNILPGEISSQTSVTITEYLGNLLREFVETELIPLLDEKFHFVRNLSEYEIIDEGGDTIQVLVKTKKGALSEAISDDIKSRIRDLLKSYPSITLKGNEQQEDDENLKNNLLKLCLSVKNQSEFEHQTDASTKTSHLETASNESHSEEDYADKSRPPDSTTITEAWNIITMKEYLNEFTTQFKVTTEASTEEYSTVSDKISYNSISEGISPQTTYSVTDYLEDLLRKFVKTKLIPLLDQKFHFDRNSSEYEIIDNGGDTVEIFLKTKDGAMSQAISDAIKSQIRDLLEDYPSITLDSNEQHEDVDNSKNNSLILRLTVKTQLEFELNTNHQTDASTKISHPETTHDRTTKTEASNIITTKEYSTEFTEQSKVITWEVKSEEYEHRIEVTTSEDESKVTTVEFELQEYEDQIEVTTPDYYTKIYEPKGTTFEEFEDKLEVTTTEDYDESYGSKETTFEVEPEEYKDRFEIAAAENNSKNQEAQEEVPSSKEFDDKSKQQVNLSADQSGNYFSNSEVPTTEDYAKRNESKETTFEVKPEEYKDRFEMAAAENYSKDQKPQKEVLSSEALDDKSKEQKDVYLPEDQSGNYDSNSELISDKVNTEKYTEQLDMIATENHIYLDSMTPEQNIEISTEKIKLTATEAHLERYESETEITLFDVYKDTFEGLASTKNYESDVTPSKDNNDKLEVTITKDHSMKDLNFDKTTSQVYLEELNLNYGSPTTQSELESSKSEIGIPETPEEKHKEKHSKNDNPESEVTKMIVTPDEYESRSEVPDTEEYTEQYETVMSHFNIDEDDTEESQKTSTEVYIEHFKVQPESPREEYTKQIEGYSTEKYLNKYDGIVTGLNAERFTGEVEISTIQGPSEKYQLGTKENISETSEGQYEDQLDQYEDYLGEYETQTEMKDFIMNEYDKTTKLEVNPIDVSTKDYGTQSEVTFEAHLDEYTQVIDTITTADESKEYGSNDETAYSVEATENYSRTYATQSKESTEAYTEKYSTLSNEIPLNSVPGEISSHTTNGVLDYPEDLLRKFVKAVLIPMLAEKFHFDGNISDYKVIDEQADTVEVFVRTKGGDLSEVVADDIRVEIRDLLENYPTISLNRNEPQEDVENLKNNSMKLGLSVKNQSKFEDQTDASTDMSHSDTKSDELYSGEDYTGKYGSHDQTTVAEATKITTIEEFLNKYTLQSKVTTEIYIEEYSTLANKISTKTLPGEILLHTTDSVTDYLEDSMSSEDNYAYESHDKKTITEASTINTMEDYSNKHTTQSRVTTEAYTEEYSTLANEIPFNTLPKEIPPLTADFDTDYLEDLLRKFVEIELIPLLDEKFHFDRNSSKYTIIDEGGDTVEVLVETNEGAMSEAISDDIKTQIRDLLENYPAITLKANEQQEDVDNLKNNSMKLGLSVKNQSEFELQTDASTETSHLETVSNESNSEEDYAEKYGSPDLTTITEASNIITTKEFSNKFTTQFEVTTEPSPEEYSTLVKEISSNSFTGLIPSETTFTVSDCLEDVLRKFVKTELIPLLDEKFHSEYNIFDVGVNTVKVVVKIKEGDLSYSISDDIKSQIMDLLKNYPTIALEDDKLATDIEYPDNNSLKLILKVNNQSEFGREEKTSSESEQLNYWIPSFDSKYSIMNESSLEEEYVIIPPGGLPLPFREVFLPIGGIPPILRGH